MQEWDEQNTRILKRDGVSNINTLIWPGLIASVIKQNATLDARQMAILAWQVMDYRRSHNGTLPESLDALDGASTNSSNGRPFECEHGILEHKNNNEAKRTFRGFRISQPAIEFKNGKNYRASISVPLD